MMHKIRLVLCVHPLVHYDDNFTVNNDKLY